MSFGLRNTHIRLIVYVLTRFPDIEQVVLYGPRARRGSSPSPEIDFALIGRRIDQRQVNEVLQRLNDLSLPYQFGLIVYNRIADLELIDRIDKTGVIFYRKNSPVLQTM